mgnify:FL=1
MLLECPHDGPAKARSLSATILEATLTSSIQMATTRSPSHAPLPAPVGIWPASWFHPADKGGGVPKVVTPGCPQVKKAFSDIARADPLAIAIGLVPTSFGELLGWDLAPMAAQLSGTFWKRANDKEFQSRLSSHRQGMLKKGLHVWVERCKAYDRWWFSSRATRARGPIVRRYSLRADAGRPRSA